MFVLGATYANDSKMPNDQCWQIASAAVNWDESQHGCLSNADWQQSYCSAYNECISH